MSGITETRRWGDTITYEGRIKLHSCPTCGTVLGIPEDMEAAMLRARDRGESGARTNNAAYCPVGHPWEFTVIDSENARLKRRLEATEGILRDAEDRLASERRSHAATKGKLTKTRNRVAKGVCPCCNRSFTNLSRHMASQHPGFGSDHAEESK